MLCRICGREIVLVPSAKERARKYGGKSSDYSKLFTEHSECLVKERNDAAIKLMRSKNVRVSRSKP